MEEAVESRAFVKEGAHEGKHEVNYFGIDKSIKIKDALDHFRNLIGQAKVAKDDMPKARMIGKESQVWKNLSEESEKKIEAGVDYLPQRKRSHISNLEDAFADMDRTLDSSLDLTVREAKDESSQNSYLRFKTYLLGGDDYAFHISIKNANQKERDAFHKAFKEFNAEEFIGEDSRKAYRDLIEMTA